LSHSKFKNIVFPFYGKIKKPYDIKHSKNIIKANFHINNKYYIIDKLDDSTYGLTYFERLAKLETRIEYEYTCRNMTELINSPVKWGVDNVGKLYNLYNKETFRIATKKIRNIKSGLIWLHNISYPFIIDKTINLEEIDTKVLKAVVVYIDYVWVLYRFTYEAVHEETIRL